MLVEILLWRFHCISFYRACIGIFLALQWQLRSIRATLNVTVDSHSEPEEEFKFEEWLMDRLCSIEKVQQEQQQQILETLKKVQQEQQQQILETPRQKIKCATVLRQSLTFFTTIMLLFKFSLALSLPRKS
eukprot:6491481-Amphidinium_carterae.2